MVYNGFIKCEVCGAVTRIRMQVGWLDGHPIAVACQKCGISLSGKVNIDQDNRELSFQFKNAKFLTDAKPDYVVECSGEFPTAKQASDEDLPIGVVTPFLKNVMRFNDMDSYEKFCKNVLAIKTAVDNWEKYERIFDLYENGRIDLLKMESKKLFPQEYCMCRDEYEVLRVVHLVEIHCFIANLREDILRNTELGKEIMTMNTNQLQDLIRFLNSHDGYSLKELQRSIHSIMSAFTKVFGALIPAYALQFFRERIDYDTEGTTTSSYEEVKEFYIDAYETLGNLLIIPVALNNILYRGNYDQLDSSIDNGGSLKDFIAKTKANRFHFCSKAEKYTELLRTEINVKIRNAIGHKDVVYDTITQEITYTPDPKNRAKKHKEYLLEFEDEEMHLFQAILVISEYLYQLMKIELITNGVTPIQ